MNELLADMLSGDPERVCAAAAALIRLRDGLALDALVDSIELMRRHTRKLRLGGAWIPNSVHVEFALRRLEFHRDRRGCFCLLYPEYLFFDPHREVSTGSVQVLATQYLQAQWVDHYRCGCCLCQRQFRVEERDYHYTWWRWSLLDPTDPKP